MYLLDSQTVAGAVGSNVVVQARSELLRASSNIAAIAIGTSEVRCLSLRVGDSGQDEKSNQDSAHFEFFLVFE
jgi:hypothetical protein